MLDPRASIASLAAYRVEGIAGEFTTLVGAEGFQNAYRDDFVSYAVRWKQTDFELRARGGGHRPEACTESHSVDEIRNSER